MADRVKWTENASCPGCGKLAKIVFQRQPGKMIDCGLIGARPDTRPKSRISVFSFGASIAKGSRD
jgi:hypothetical protein